MFKIKFAKVINFVFFLNLIFFLPIDYSRAQTLDESIYNAYQISSEVINAQSDIHISEKDKDVKFKEVFFPKISVSTEATHKVYINPAPRINTWNTNLSAFTFVLNQNIPVSSRQIFYLQKKLDSQIRQSRITLLIEKKKVLEKVITKYLNVYQRQTSLRLYDKNVKSSREYYEEAQQSYNLGGITEVDLLQARTNYLTAISKYNIEKSNLGIEKSKFKNIVGLSVGKELEFPEIAGDLPSSLEEAIERGLNNDMTLAKLNENLNSIKIDKSLTYTGYYPKVTFRAFLENERYNLNSSKDLFTHMTENNSISGVLKVEYSLFNPEKKSKIKIIDLKIVKQTELIVKTRKDVKEIISVLWEKGSQIKSKIAEQQLIVELSELTLAGVQKELSLGASSILDLLNAEATTLKKKVELEAYIIEDLALKFKLLVSLGMMSI